jgi:cytochrome c oxidase cbb3-type subunit I/II
MWASGITQGLMWRAVDNQGHLMYPDFVETVMKIVPLYWVRAFGGLLFIVGFFVMVYNIYKTIQSAPANQEQMGVTVVDEAKSTTPDQGHRKLEGLATVFTILTVLAVLVGSVIEIYPTLSLHKYVQANQIIDPYTPLELAGRDVYIKEGCYVCHTQQIRPLAAEVLRYGPASTIEESMYDHPFQWGSKRTGPDLSRIGKKYPDLWHYRHMIDPRSIVAKSIMPSYTWLDEKKVDFVSLRKKLSVMKMLNVPYDQDTIANADIVAQKQAQTIADQLVAEGAPQGLADKEIVALIAYLQALGQKGKKQ